MSSKTVNIGGSSSKAEKSGSGTGPKKDPMIEEFRQLYFQELVDNRSAMFNFFYENNDRLKFISEEDEGKLQKAYFNYVNRTFYSTFGTLAAVVLTDRYIFPRFFPTFRFKSFRGLIFVGKYLLSPLVGFKIGKELFCQDTEQLYLDMSNKYNFGWDEYDKAIDILADDFRKAAEAAPKPPPQQQPKPQ